MVRHPNEVLRPSQIAGTARCRIQMAKENEVGAMGEHAGWWSAFDVGLRVSTARATEERACPGFLRNLSR